MTAAGIRRPDPDGGRPRTGGRSGADEPRHHWGIVVLFLVAVLLALLLNGFTEHTVGRSSTPPEKPRGAPGSGLDDSRPVLDLSGKRPRAMGMPPRTVAVTFDDGPDPKWTPRILEILRRHGAHATFFVTGSQAARHPELVRRMLREGHEVASHTYTHADIGGVPPWRTRLELGLTENALAGAAGIRPRLMRPPYSSVPSALQGRLAVGARRASEANYRVVLADHDTDDWARPGAGRILAAATPREPDGGIVLMHDGGGDRTQTVVALERLIGDLRDKGYRMPTVTEALDLPAAGKATTRERMMGRALIWSAQVSVAVSAVMTVLLIVVAVIIGLRLIMLPLFARAHARARDRAPVPAPTAGVGPADPVSVIVPAYNEAIGIAATVRSLLRTTYPGEVEVVVVDDGSTDGTAEVVAGVGSPRVRVVRQPNGGKAAALNTGIANAAHDVIVLIDADTIFLPETIGWLVAPLADPQVGAVAGSPRVGNRRRVIGRWQHLEYVMGSNLDRRMFDVLQCLTTVPGAVGTFRREAIVSAGGVSDQTLAEDTDLTMALWRAGWRVVCEERAIALTEAPQSVRQLWMQRYRWCYGTLQSMWKHRHAVVERGRAGRFGRRGLVQLTLFQVLLPLFSPVIDLFAIYGIIFLQPDRVAAVWLAFLAAQAVGAAYALRLAREPLRILWSLPLQQIVYRQMMYLVVIHSLVTALLGAQKGWQANRRFGTFEPAASPATRR